MPNFHHLSTTVSRCCITLVACGVGTSFARFNRLRSSSHTTIANFLKNVQKNEFTDYRAFVKGHLFTCRPIQLQDLNLITTARMCQQTPLHSKLLILLLSVTNLWMIFDKIGRCSCKTTFSSSRPCMKHHF